MLVDITSERRPNHIEIDAARLNAPSGFGHPTIENITGGPARIYGGTTRCARAVLKWILWKPSRIANPFFQCLDTL
jgi:hypothetical protein